MRLHERAVLLLLPGRTLALVALLLACVTGRAASLQTFADIFHQLTNEIALIQQTFDGSSTQKLRLATISQGRRAILDEELRDEETLARLVSLLKNADDYAGTLGTAATNARSTVLARYDSLALQVADLPPSRRANLAENRFDNLADEHRALANAATASGISQLLSPFGARLQSVANLLPRARVMPRPRVGSNAVRASVNGRRFISASNGRNSPNLFDVTAPDDTYRSVMIRAVDGPSVIHLALPVITGDARYEVAQGLAGVLYTPDVFTTNSVTMSATNGTFFVQSVRNEIYGTFTCAGPGFEIKDGRFRVEIPRRLRGP